MTATPIDLDTWPRAGQFRFFRTFAQPHYATTVRIDVTAMMTARAVRSISPFRASLFAIGSGIHAVPELRMRFKGDRVTLYDRIEMSTTVPLDNGDFRYAYLTFDPDFSRFDAECQRQIEAVKSEAELRPNTGDRNDLAYMSCMPWLDYSSINNALPGPDDCIPRVSWGKIVAHADGRRDMAMTIEVHHALVDGRQVGDYFAAVQAAIDAV